MMAAEHIDINARLKEIEKKLKNQLADHLSSDFELTWAIVAIFLLAVVIILLVVICGLWKLKRKVLPSPATAQKPRFRKREKLIFYGIKMLRKVRSFTKNTMTKDLGLGKSRIKIAKRLLRMKKEAVPQRKVQEPPRSFLEADTPEMEDIEARLPPEVLYMLRSVRVFGNFEKPLFLELCKYMESLFIPAGGYLFRVGEQDDSIFVLQSGKIDVLIVEPDGSQYPMKVVFPGESIHSLLSVVDILTGHPSSYKTVSAKAVIDSTVLCLPAYAFQKLFTRFPESLVRVVQIIMVRLQRVTFMALHNYLGLSTELMNQTNQSDQSLSIHSLASQKESVITSHYATEHGAGSGSSRLSASWPAGSTAHTGPTPSDFQAACARARVDHVACDISRASLNKKSSTDTARPQYVSSRERWRKPNHPDNTSSSNSLSADDEKILELAKQDLVTLFKLEDPDALDGKLYLRYLKSGAVLIRQGDQDSSLIFVVTGLLKMLQNVVGEEQKETTLFLVHPGEIVGPLAVLTGEPSMFSMKAKGDSRVVMISKNDFYSIMQRQPSVVLHVAHTIVRRMSPFVRQIDFALDWIMIEAGRALFRQGDNSDCVYIVLTGRLRCIITLVGGKKEFVEEYGRGELVGIVEVLTQTQRATTVMAVRDTELAQLPAELINLIKRRYPQIVTRLIHLLGQRILGNLQNRNTVAITEHPTIENRPSVTNLATVAVMPISSDVPLTNFTLELQHALQGIGATIRLTSDIVKNRLGANAMDSVNEFRLFSWLGQQEDIHRVVLYQCDSSVNRWTRNCIRQADCVLIVGLADKDPTVVGELEKQLESLAVRAQKELVLLHTEDKDHPSGTVEWLNARGWCCAHHHIKCPPRVFSKKSKTLQQQIYERLFQTEPDRLSDFSRLARLLTGTAIGVVLGGGGARGIAHVGMIKAITEAGIPIDMVGGTSIGSMIGALWCEHTNLTTFTQTSRKWAMVMTSFWKKLVDLTYPSTSVFTGSSFNQSLEDVFKSRQIEDLWIPYFCISTDISASRMRIHTHGSLWRYTRASMTLAGYLPPLCDPHDGHLLVDGGYVNNLPADVMRAMGAQTIFAIDVGSQDDQFITNYGDELSGWWLLWKKINPLAKPVRVPDMNEIQSRLTYVSCMRQLEIVKNCDYCEYIRPPIDRYHTLQFGSFDDINEVGYRHGKAMFDAWIKGGLVQDLFREKTPERSKTHHARGIQPVVPAMASFTDLAELVSKIEHPRGLSISASLSGSDPSDICLDDSDVAKADSSKTLINVDYPDEDIMEEDDDDDEYDDVDDDFEEDGIDNNGAITVETNPIFNMEDSPDENMPSSTPVSDGLRQRKPDKPESSVDP